MFSRLSKLRLQNRIIEKANAPAHEQQARVIRGAAEVAFFRQADFDWYSYDGKRGRSFAFAGKKFKLKPGEVFAISRAGLQGRRAVLIPSQDKRMFAMIDDKKASSLSRRSKAWKGSVSKYMADWDFRK